MKIHVTPLTVHVDPRGWLIENEVIKARNNMKHFFVSSSRPGVVRGQHYHKRKREWFIVVRGKGEIVFRDISSDDMTTVQVTTSKPTMIEIPPLIAHAIINTGKEEMIVIGIVNEHLDRENPDTFPFRVIK